VFKLRLNQLGAEKVKYMLHAAKGVSGKNYNFAA
jgi:hypothetical protein